jgi:protein-S-isoprenylcysteine O-methyltransferase Ste14
VCFVASLAYFLFTYATTFGIVAPGPLRATDVAWDVALFSVFALHHSVFAREPIRRRVTQTFPHLERSVYVWIASVLLVLVCVLWRPVAGVVWDVGAGAAAWALRILQVAGIWLSVYSASLIDIWELSGIRQLNSQPPTPNSQRDQPPTVGSWEFSTRGPYGWVRHPIYLGWFLIVFAVGTMTMTRFVFSVVSCAYTLIAIPFEERSLRNTTGGAYERYVTKVPWKLVPRLF